VRVVQNWKKANFWTDLLRMAKQSDRIAVARELVRFSLVGIGGGVDDF